MKSNWRTKVIDNEILNNYSNTLGINKFIASILLSRGIANINDAYQFLNPRLSALHSPFLMKGMYEAVMRIRNAITRNEKIGIFADSDVDGLSSLTILNNLFERIGIKPYYRYTVDDEDYGLKKEIIDEIHNNNINLLITLDCGIRDIEEIKYAREIGMDVIVCDHHEQKNELPSAIIINPKLWDSNYPFKELAGVGVTFKLCHAILMSYLQSFNKFFVLVTEDENLLYLSYFKNGIIQKIEKVRDIYELNNLNNITGENYSLIIYDLDNEKILHKLIKDIKFYSFKSLLNIVFDEKISGNITIDDLCKFFSINQKVFTKKHEIVNLIFSEIEYNNSIKITDYVNSIIDLVSIGTIADIMPVAGENRTIIHHGLKSLNLTSHPGLSLLIKKLASRITAKKIAWKISPFLNTPGRFGKTNLIAKFFLEKDQKNLSPIIDEINKLNIERKRFLSDLFDIFTSEISCGKHVAGDNLIFIVSEKVPEGLCGLLANRIADTTDMPVIIISMRNNKEIVKGSGRAIGDFNFFSIVESHSYLFEKIGGHKQAFGFTICRENIETIRKRICDSIDNNFIKRTDYNIDLDIPIEIIDYDLVNSLNLFEPYGYKNDECLFLTRNAALKNFKRFGKYMNHGKYTFQNNKMIEAIGWDMAEAMEKYIERKKVDIIYKLENNFYNGRIFPRMLIVDLDYTS